MNGSEENRVKKMLTRKEFRIAKLCSKSFSHNSSLIYLFI